MKFRKVILLFLIFSLAASCQVDEPVIVEPPELRCVDFAFYPDNAHPGTDFMISGLRFLTLGTLDPIVNDVSPNIRGLQIDPQGLEIIFPGLVDKIELEAGSYTPDSLQIVAQDENGDPVDSKSVPGDNSTHNLVLGGNNIQKLILTGGGFEGILVNICIISQAGFSSLPCIDFEDQQFGATQHVGDVMLTSGSLLRGAGFQDGNGAMNTSGYSEVHNSGDAGGTGQDLEVNNLLIEFEFGTAISSLTGQFGEYGGNLNISVNGVFQNFNDLNDINGTTIDNVEITVTNGMGNDQGTIHLEGDIHSFALGGQELFLDNLCPIK